MNYALKAAYNAALKAARLATKGALAARKAIVAAESRYSGPSVGYLEDAVDSLASAKKFATE